MRRILRRTAALLALAALGSPTAATAEWYADVDFLLLTPSIPSQGFDHIFYRGAPATASASGNFTDSMQFATRLQLGFEDCCCFGGRIRWFSMDVEELGYSGSWDNGGGPVALSTTTRLDVDAIDFEGTQRGSFGMWNLLGSAGLRYGRVELVEPFGAFGGLAGAVFGGATGVNFEGVGPTLALEGRRAVSDSGLTLFASGRTSLLLGDVDNQSPFILLPYEVNDEIVQVWEFQLGVEYAKTLSNGATVETGIFWETQRWDSENNSLGDLSLMGLGIHSGITY